MRTGEFDGTLTPWGTAVYTGPTASYFVVNSIEHLISFNDDADADTLFDRAEVMLYGIFPNSTYSASRINLDLSTVTVVTSPVSAVPVPGAVWLLGSGLATLGGYRLRRKNKA